MRNETIRVKDDEESLTFIKGKRAWYCVYARGVVTRTWLKSLREEKIAVYVNRGRAQFKANGKQYVLKHVVARAFLPEYKKGLNVIVRDGDELNCAVANLEISSNRELGKRSGPLANVSIAILVKAPNGNQTVYPSIRAAAKPIILQLSDYAELLEW